MQLEGPRWVQEDKTVVTFNVSGNYRKTRKFLKNAENLNFNAILDKYGKQGVEALRAKTPKRTGKTADSWYYKVSKGLDGFTIYWNNSNVNQGVNIALIIQYGHGTRSGYFIKGRDYINPAIRPIFDAIGEAAWKEVNKE